MSRIPTEAEEEAVCRSELAEQKFQEVRAQKGDGLYNERLGCSCERKGRMTGGMDCPHEDCQVGYYHIELGPKPQPTRIKPDEQALRDLVNLAHVRLDMAHREYMNRLTEYSDAIRRMMGGPT